ncbi:MAG TPA: rubrerythrin [Ruminococcaceae bacterium]|nr:rubrerythrin [Oscillospiraceae bacterium]
MNSGKSKEENEYKGRDFFNAHDKTAITITTRDRLLQSWERTMELARDFKKYSEIEKNAKEGPLFKQLSELQGQSAAKLHNILLEYEYPKD